jgi:hypothetical protein
MICRYCKYAGQQLQLARENEAIFPLVKVAHSQCEAPTTCTCQHEADTVQNILSSPHGPK